MQSRLHGVHQINRVRPTQSQRDLLLSRVGKDGAVGIEANAFLRFILLGRAILDDLNAPMPARKSVRRLQSWCGWWMEAYHSAFVFAHILGSGPYHKRRLANPRRPEDQRV